MHLQFASYAYLLGVFVHAYLETNRAEAAQRRKEPASAFPVRFGGSVDTIAS